MSGKSWIAAAAVLTAVAAAAAQVPRDARTFWNERYQKSESLANTQPNAFLGEMVKSRKPGRALDVGMGQGRNAIFLAKSGWDVTGFDISDVALNIARKQAGAAGVNINAIQKDLKDWDYGKEQWDLILLCYMQGDARFRAKDITEALRPGGIVVIETWHQDMDKDLGRKVGGFETNEVFTRYGGLRIRRYEDVRAVPDWGKELGGVPRPIVRIMAEKPAVAE